MMYPNESVIALLTASLILHEIRFPVSYCGARLIACA
jgi:hypothetical protein